MKDENTNKEPNAEGVAYEETSTFEPRSIQKKAGMANQPANPDGVNEHSDSDVPENERAQNTTHSPARDPKEVAPEGNPPGPDALARNAALSGDTDHG